MESIGWALLAYFWRWITNPTPNVKAVGFFAGLALIIIGAVLLGMKIERWRSKERVNTGERDWSLRKRGPPIDPAHHLDVWLAMTFMLVFGILFGGAFLLVPFPETPFILRAIISALTIGFTAAFPSWFLINETLNIRDANADRARTLGQRKEHCLHTLTEAYNALKNIPSVQAKKVILETVRTELRSLTQGELDSQGNTLRPLYWDDEIVKKVEEFFPVVAIDLKDSDMASNYAETLKYVFLENNAKVVDAMKKALTSPFDKAYPSLTFGYPMSLFIFDCIAGLHGYDSVTVVGFIDDALVGSPEMFDALVRSLSTDLLSNLKSKGDCAQIKIDIGRRISQYEGKNEEAVNRARQLAEMF